MFWSLKRRRELHERAISAIETLASSAKAQAEAVQLQSQHSAEASKASLKTHESSQLLSELAAKKTRVELDLLSIEKARRLILMNDGVGCWTTNTPENEGTYLFRNGTQLAIAQVTKFAEAISNADGPLMARVCFAGELRTREFNVLQMEGEWMDVTEWKHGVA